LTSNVPVVLVVDIDPDTHTLTEGALPETECALVSARSSEIALKMAERRPPAVLVIGDRVSGAVYLTERLRRLAPHLHVVVLTSPDPPQEPGLFSHADANAGRTRATAASMLRKPVDPSRFRTTLRTALRLSAMAAGVKRMHGGTTESTTMARITPVPWTSAARDSDPGREDK
jgi:CheY-like chemotaxis protein